MNLKDALPKPTRSQPRRGYPVPREQGNHIASAGKMVKSPPDYAPYRSRWEKEYAEHLEIRRRVGAIIESWKYEPMRFKLADGAHYTPDFMVKEHDGTIWFEEVKGFERPAAILRWKVAAELYPMFRWRMLTKKDGAWIVTREK